MIFFFGRERVSLFFCVLPGFFWVGFERKKVALKLGRWDEFWLDLVDSIFPHGWSEKLIALAGYGGVGSGFTLGRATS